MNHNKSQLLKTHVVGYLLYRGGYHAVATEYHTRDVFAVNRNGYTCEVEVKVSPSDLMSEIETMKYLLNPNNDPSYPIVECKNGKKKTLAKFDKHRSYLLDEAKHSPRPRYFYFAVPEVLKEKALQELANSPYGLLIDVGNFVIKAKKAEVLSDNKFDDYFYFLRKASNENYQLRKKLIMNNLLLPTEGTL